MVVNVTGVSNAKSKGVKDRRYRWHQRARQRLSNLYSQAEESKSRNFNQISKRWASNKLICKYGTNSGNDSCNIRYKEITDQDVEDVVKSALTKSMTLDREVITLFQKNSSWMASKGIRDPGMMGVRLKCVVYFTQVLVRSLHTFARQLNVVSRLIMWLFHLGDCKLVQWRRTWILVRLSLTWVEVRTTVATIRNQELQFTNIYQEGGDYVTGKHF